MRAVFVCQAVDRDDPILATTIRWIEALARQPAVSGVTVLALRTGRHGLPPAVDVRRFGKSSRLGTLFGFYGEVARSLRDRPDFFFIYQGGPYPLLLLPTRLLRRTAVVQWKAHPAISRAMDFYARYCDDLIFTPTQASFPVDLPKVRAVGHGIDTELFRPRQVAITEDLISVCRIAPRKRIAEMITAVVGANRRFGTAHRLDVYGPIHPDQERYASALQDMIGRLRARDWIALHGPVAHDRMPALLNQHRAFLSFGESAVDKAVIEAMACGLPVISTTSSVSQILPTDLRSILITDGGSEATQAMSIHELLIRPDAELDEIGGRMRRLAVAEHSVDRLFERIVSETQEWLSARR